MNKEPRLVKTCVGLVSEYAVLCLCDRAIEIAIYSDITIEDALIILLKLASRCVDRWYACSKGWYLDFDYKFDHFIVYKLVTDTEIACVYNDNYSIYYSIKNQKFYKEYPANKHSYDTIKEEIEI